MWQRNPLAGHDASTMSTAQFGDSTRPKSPGSTWASTSASNAAFDVVQLIRADLAAAATPEEFFSATDLAYARAKAALEASQGGRGVEPPLDEAGLRTLRAVAALCENDAQISEAAAQNSCAAALHVCDVWQSHVAASTRDGTLRSDGGRGAWTAECEPMRGTDR
jgi:hypothetical protein